MNIYKKQKKIRTRDCLLFHFIHDKSEVTNNIGEE